MTKISFYVLGPSSGDRNLFICRLLETIYKRGQHCYAYTQDQALRQHIDDMLWTFRDDSFVPHDLEETDNTSPIVLGCGNGVPAQRDVILNLDFPATAPPDFFSCFERTLEFVSGDEASKKAARSRYSFYRDRGYEMETHQIGQ